MASSRDIAQAVKEGADIVQVIGERVALAPNGANFKGLCPFHSEKTPSFMVNPQRGMFHCFGCKAGGSVIDFVMAYERVPFAEALTSLAARLGIQTDRRDGAAPGGRAAELLEKTREYYRDHLLRRPEAEAARAYLRGRGFGEEAWEAFRIGFALDGWQGLTGHASGQGFSLEDQLAAGLVKRSESGRPYDLLRGRIVFPIHEPGGRCVAFGARAIGSEDQPKYLNTPETRFYRKGRVLFGLAEGQEALRKGRRALLVEGYLDVIRLHGNGFPEAVATCGTALTADHLALLERYVDQVVLLFDGDEAGSKAAMRSAALFLNSTLEARVATLPGGLDPDDLLARQGPAALAETVERAKPILEYLVWETLSRHGNSLAGKERALRELVPVLSEIKRDSARDVTVRFLADLIGIRAEHISSMLKTGARAKEGDSRAGTPVSLTAREERHQRMFLKILLQQPTLLGKARELLQPGEMEQTALRSLYEEILALGDETFAALAADSLVEQCGAAAPALRSLLVENTVWFRALSCSEADLICEMAFIKEAHKNRLWRELKQVADTEEEELALRRYFRVRDELRAMKSIPGARDRGKPGRAEPGGQGQQMPSTG